MIWQVLNKLTPLPLAFAFANLTLPSFLKSAHQANIMVKRISDWTDCQNTLHRSWWEIRRYSLGSFLEVVNHTLIHLHPSLQNQFKLLKKYLMKPNKLEKQLPIFQLMHLYAILCKIESHIVENEEAQKQMQLRQWKAALLSQLKSRFKQFEITDYINWLFICPQHNLELSRNVLSALDQAMVDTAMIRILLSPRVLKTLLQALKSFFGWHQIRHLSKIWNFIAKQSFCQYFVPLNSRFDVSLMANVNDFRLDLLGYPTPRILIEQFESISSNLNRFSLQNLCHTFKILKQLNAHVNLSHLVSTIFNEICKLLELGDHKDMTTKIISSFPFSFMSNGQIQTILNIIFQNNSKGIIFISSYGYPSFFIKFIHRKAIFTRFFSQVIFNWFKQIIHSQSFIQHNITLDVSMSLFKILHETLPTENEPELQRLFGLWISRMFFFPKQQLNLETLYFVNLLSAFELQLNYGAKICLNKFEETAIRQALKKKHFHIELGFDSHFRFSGYYSCLKIHLNNRFSKVRNLLSDITLQILARLQAQNHMKIIAIFIILQFEAAEINWPEYHNVLHQFSSFAFGKDEQSSSAAAYLEEWVKHNRKNVNCTNYLLSRLNDFKMIWATVWPLLINCLIHSQTVYLLKVNSSGKLEVHKTIAQFLEWVSKQQLNCVSDLIKSSHLKSVFSWFKILQQFIPSLKSTAFKLIIQGLAKVQKQFQCAFEDHFHLLLIQENRLAMVDILKWTTQILQMNSQKHQIQEISDLNFKLSHKYLTYLQAANFSLELERQEIILVVQLLQVSRTGKESGMKQKEKSDELRRFLRQYQERKNMIPSAYQAFLLISFIKKQIENFSQQICEMPFYLKQLQSTMSMNLLTVQQIVMFTLDSSFINHLAPPNHSHSIKLLSHFLLQLIQKEKGLVSCRTYRLICKLQIKLNHDKSLDSLMEDAQQTYAFNQNDRELVKTYLLDLN